MAGAISWRRSKICCAPRVPSGTSKTQELGKYKIGGQADLPLPDSPWSFPGASGLHIFVPLREGTPYESGQIFCEIVATLVADVAGSLSPEQRNFVTVLAGNGSLNQLLRVIR